MQPLLICVVFFMCTLRQDNSAPPLTEELYACYTLRPKHLDMVFFFLLLRSAPSVWTSVSLGIGHIRSTAAFKIALKTPVLKTNYC